MDRFVTNLGYPQPEILRLSMSAQSPSYSSRDWVVAAASATCRRSPDRRRTQTVLPGLGMEAARPPCEVGEKAFAFSLRL